MLRPNNTENCWQGCKPKASPGCTWPEPEQFKQDFDIFPLHSKRLLCFFFLSCSCIILMNTHNRLFQELTKIIFTHLVCSQHLKSDSKPNDSRLNQRPCCGVSPVRYSGFVVIFSTDILHGHSVKILMNNSFTYLYKRNCLSFYNCNCSTVMSVNSSTFRRAPSQRSWFIATADYATIISIYTLFTLFSGKVTGCFVLDTCRFCQCECQLEKTKWRLFSFSEERKCEQRMR